MVSVIVIVCTGMIFPEPPISVFLLAKKLFSFMVASGIDMKGAVGRPRRRPEHPFGRRSSFRMLLVTIENWPICSGSDGARWSYGNAKQKTNPNSRIGSSISCHPATHLLAHHVGGDMTEYGVVNAKSPRLAANRRNSRTFGPVVLTSRAGMRRRRSCRRWRSGYVYAPYGAGERNSWGKRKDQGRKFYHLISCIPSHGVRRCWRQCNYRNFLLVMRRLTLTERESPMRRSAKRHSATGHLCQRLHHVGQAVHVYPIFA